MIVFSKIQNRKLIGNFGRRSNSVDRLAWWRWLKIYICIYRGEYTGDLRRIFVNVWYRPSQRYDEIESRIRRDEIVDETARRSGWRERENASDRLVMDIRSSESTSKHRRRPSSARPWTLYDALGYISGNEKLRTKWNRSKIRARRKDKAFFSYTTCKFEATNARWNMWATWIDITASISDKKKSEWKINSNILAIERLKIFCIYLFMYFYLFFFCLLVI